MSEWSLAQIFASLHDDIQQRLATVNKTLSHSVTKGNASENVWLGLLNSYLPKRYQADTARVVDSRGKFSDQIDVVVFDRQYSPFVFRYEEQTVVPAESVYAVFEVKQIIKAKYVRYAQEKVASVRRLHRTTLPIPHAGGTFPAKPLIPIYGGILAFESDWNPALGTPLLKALDTEQETARIDLGCVAAHGYFTFKPEVGTYDVCRGGKPATSFLFELISQLQFSGTVPMIDIRAYAEWLSK